MARGRPYNAAIAAAQKWATRLHASLYRATDGRVGGRLLGSPVLLLVTTGRRTGQRRTTPLLYLEDQNRYVVVASNGGAPKHPVWWLNLRDGPEAAVEVGDRKVRVRAREARDGERERLWRGLVKMYPPYENYQRKTDRRIPVAVLEPVE